jgi:hypothetical protein
LCMCVYVCCMRVGGCLCVCDTTRHDRKGERVDTQ